MANNGAVLKRDKLNNRPVAPRLQRGVKSRAMHKGFEIVKQFGVFAAASVMLLSGAALAQEDTAGDGIYVRVGAGVGFVGDLEQDLTSLPGAACLAIGCNPDRQIVELDNGFTAAAALGFNYTEGIRTELEYRYATSGISNRSVLRAALM